jgi:uncharacterized protein YaiL (DUF2058 family)
MSSSLRDQLIKSGLVSVDRARKVERQARAEKHADRRAKTQAEPGGTGAAGAQTGTGPDAPTSAAAIARARAVELNIEKARRDRALQEEIKEKAAAKALRAELKQLIQQHDQRARTSSDDDVPYNFVHGKKVKRIYISRAQQAQLSSGSLVVVNDDGRYHLVSKEVAERVRARDPKRIIAAHGAASEQAPEPGSDAEFYARFQVPDDLDW